MSIFGIMGISLLMSFIAFAIGMFIAAICDLDFDYEEDKPYFIVMSIIVAVIFVASIFIGIGLNTENAKIWSAKFEAQKTTIEQSLDSDVLSGLERIELVKTATELNGELAERKATSELWHVVYYADNVYEGLEPIVIK